MKGRIKEILSLSGGEWQITLTTRVNPVRMFYRMKDKDLDIDIKVANPKRSLTANAFCWALCSDIGKAMTPPLAKEEVYRKAIRAVGVYTQLKVLIWDVDTLVRRWSSHGEGWFVDIVDDAGRGYKLVNLYYGSSTYSADEMRLLLDWLVDEAEQLEIQIPLSKSETERIIELWGKASCKPNGNAISAEG